MDNLIIPISCRLARFRGQLAISTPRLRLVVALMVAGIQLMSVGSMPSVPEVRAQETATMNVVPGEYIVMLNQAVGFNAASVTAAYDRDPGIEVEQTFNNVIDGFSGELTPDAVAELLADPNVASVTPN